MRIGFDAGYASASVDPELAEAVAGAVKVLEDLGAEIVEVQMLHMGEYTRAWRTLCSAEAIAAHEADYPSRRDDYGPWFREWLDHGASVTGADYARANNLRNECAGRVRRTFEGIDALACPSMPHVPGVVTKAAV